MQGQPGDKIIMHGVEYCFDGNIRRDGERVQRYLENTIGLRFIILSTAYNSAGEMAPGYVAIFVADRRTDYYLKWWRINIRDAN